MKETVINWQNIAIALGSLITFIWTLKRWFFDPLKNEMKEIKNEIKHEVKEIKSEMNKNKEEIKTEISRLTTRVAIIETKIEMSGKIVYIKQDESDKIKES